MSKIKLSEINTSAGKDWDKQQTKENTQKIHLQLNDLQNLLYAENKHSVLVIIQSMDTSGKDGAIKNVFGTLIQQGVGVKSYKSPESEDLRHDFLWRIHQNTTPKGFIQICKERKR
jgi:polyphosphate kinase 2 (PPK2 family)